MRKNTDLSGPIPYSNSPVTGSLASIVRALFITGLFFVAIWIYISIY